MPEFDSTGEQLYIVCNQCGEAFDSITPAYAHQLQRDCGSPQGFDIMVESEAM